MWIFKVKTIFIAQKWPPCLLMGMIFRAKMDKNQHESDFKGPFRNKCSCRFFPNFSASINTTLCNFHVRYDKFIDRSNMLCSWPCAYEKKVEFHSILCTKCALYSHACCCVQQY